MLEYQLIRSARRKTLGLQVKHGKVIVRAPSFLTDQQILSFIKEKSTWLKTKVDLQRSLPQFTAISLVHGSMLWINGEQKKLTIIYQPMAQILNLRDEFRVVLALRNRIENNTSQASEAVINVTNKKVKKQIEHWFKQSLESYLALRLTELSEKTNLIAKSYKVRQYKARWGSCNSRGELSFNYLLMMTPNWVIDYVIVHELCHLIHMNHSKDFWQLVAKHYPNFQLAKSWLKTHQRHLTWQ